MNRAMALKEKLVQNCHGRVLIDADFCEYVRLSHPVLRENALAHVMAADMVIVSTRGTEALPAHVQEWLNEVASLRRGEIVCAEFLGEASRTKTAAFHEVMARWASQCGCRLLSNLFPPLPGPEPAGGVSDLFAKDGAKTAHPDRPDAPMKSPGAVTCPSKQRSRHSRLAPLLSRDL